MKTALLVDDDEAINHFHELILSTTEGVQHIGTVEDGNSAVDFLRTNDAPDIILLDLNMPGMNGFEFLEVFHEAAWARELPCVVVVVTTSVLAADRRRAQSFARVVAFMEKPIDSDGLNGLLNACAV